MHRVEQLVKLAEPVRENLPIRKIVHVDMDAFYASVEQRDRPELRGKPICVAGANHHGIVAAASYEARAFGVRGGMVAAEALELCPRLTFVPPRFDAYEEASAAIHRIFADYTPKIEPQMLDEAWLDVTDNLAGIPLATDLARQVRARIRAEVGIASSAGISYNKFLAKMATNLGKPDGQFVITPARGPAFVQGLAIETFHGIGQATAMKMQDLGIATGADLLATPYETLRQVFGKLGDYFYWLARGIDDRPVVHDAIRKSVGRELTLRPSVTNLAAAKLALDPMISEVWKEATDQGQFGRTATLRVRFADLSRISRNRSARQAFSSPGEFGQVVYGMLEQIFPIEQKIRLLGAAISGFEPQDRGEGSQLALWRED